MIVDELYEADTERRPHRTMKSKGELKGNSTPRPIVSYVDDVSDSLVCGSVPPVEHQREREKERGGRQHTVNSRGAPVVL